MCVFMDMILIDFSVSEMRGWTRLRIPLVTSLKQDYTLAHVITNM